MVIMVFAVGFTAISSRLVVLQVVRHNQYEQEAIKNHYGVVPIPAKRGVVYDRNGRIFAQSETVRDLHVDGMLASRHPELLPKLAKVIEMSPEKLGEMVTPERRFVRVAKDISEEKMKLLEEIGYPQPSPLIFYERLKRVYPHDHYASHVLGFVNLRESKTDFAELKVEIQKGVTGVERAMDAYLAGQPGERRVVRDGTLRRNEIAAYRLPDREPRQGLNVVLTLDGMVQHIVEEEADRVVEEFHPEKLHIIVSKPQTGEILALCNRPTFNPNDRRGLTNQMLKNCAIMDQYEPGSTFKVVILAAAMNEHIADLDTTIFCENGKFLYSGRWIRDGGSYGRIPLRECLARSSNIAFAKLGLALRSDRLYSYARAFGFGDRAQAEEGALPGEERGLLHPESLWTNLSQVTVPIGYEVAVTNLQMTMAFGALCNGGRLMEPRLIQAVVDDQGRRVRSYLPRLVRQVVSADVASREVEALRGVVEEGTGKKASVPGYVVGGKTGTAKKLHNGRYTTEAHVASFIGYLATNEPEVVISVVVNDPKGGSYYGGSVAAPIFHNIAVRVAEHLNLPKMEVQTASFEGGER